MGEVFIDIFANNNRLRGSLAQASSLIRDWSLVVNGLTAGITNAFRIIATVGIKAVTVSLAVLTAAFAITAKSGAEFQDNIVRAFVIMKESSGATQKALQELTNEAIRLGSETLFSATQAAQGLQTLARAGFTTQEAIAAIGPVLNLAIVGNIELAEASNIATASMFGFALEAKDMTKVTDVLSLASSQANTTISLLGSALGFVAPVAQSAGLSIEETASAIGVLSNAGIRGSRAGTTLRRALSILLAPTGRAKKIFDELGVTFNSTEGGLISFTEIIKKLNKANLTAAQVQTIFGRIAGPGMAALLRQGSDALENLTNKLEGARGAADRMSQEFRTTVKGRVRDLGASIINLGLAFSERFNKPLADSIFAIRNFVKINTEALQKMGIFKAIVDGVISALSPLTEKIKELAQAFQEWLMNLTPEMVKEFFDRVGKAVDNFVKKITDPQFQKNVIAFFKGVILIVKGFIDAIVNIGKAFEKLPTSLQPLVASITGMTVALVTLFGGFINLLAFLVVFKFAIFPIIGGLGRLVKGLFAAAGATKILGFAVGTTAGVASGGFVAAMGAMAVAALPVIGVVTGIVLAIAVLAGVISKIRGEGFMKGFTEVFKAIGSGLKDLGGNIISILGKGMKGALDKIKELILTEEAFAGLEEQAEQTANKIKETMAGISDIATGKTEVEGAKSSGNIQVPISRLLSQGIGKPGDTRNQLEFQKAAENALKLGLSFKQLNDVIQLNEKRFGTSFADINESRRERAKSKLGGFLQFSEKDIPNLAGLGFGINPIDSIFGPKEKQPGFGRGKDFEKVNQTTLEQRIKNAVASLNEPITGGATGSLTSQETNEKILNNSQKLMEIVREGIGSRKDFAVSIKQMIAGQEAELEALKNLEKLTQGEEKTSINSSLGNGVGIFKK